MLIVLIFSSSLVSPSSSAAHSFCVCTRLYHFVLHKIFPIKRPCIISMVCGTLHYLNVGLLKMMLLYVASSYKNGHTLH